MSWSSLAVWAAVIAAVYGYCRPGSAAGRAMTAVSQSLSDVLGGGSNG